MLSTVAWSHQRQWPPAPCHVGEARRFVTRCLDAEGLPHLVEPAALVVSELATNAVLHARSPFEVHLERRDDHVLLEVADESDTQPQLDEGGDMDTSGRGLHLVDLLSSAWGVRALHRGGKSVWAAFSVPAGSAP